ncbi:glucose 1-dehydrogenase [bacterium M00.F.Ca.ET.228.01.1.1]|uniref:glucose 1-dehydrogenase n=1 Tax=Paraburkholderia phenoliruptrix TaxID=252970 RepID=UPI001091B36B|nr:glucose 1-dehydrogenase [Paraburkholderia phenoliruptrix]MBW9128971.1 glucose 1-dehydrogenase [Paraburkholderia ginsengiterrae]TGP40088.1 glucose 1-dehydrogenase [bacterium M00.F.Ca.ET.228.01.1.1]TGR96063.1 glucose 1-dehydrogenase [bacterium M00.F.Ca.ET.191.01.1.1]TGT97200.1 glucose 1-dehydrogenase [bacterium M00.F.Ca.ET.155.01.1.1]MBW9102688.1 glucose 1-dehydrogenase [Paraburkholderia phenoliruptrix]
MNKLKDKVAIVTGASKGIGAGIARQLAADGAKVVVNYASSKSGADEVVADIEAAGGRAVAVRADVTKEADVDALIRGAIDTFGRLDIVVNNSGVYQFAKIEETTEALYRMQFDINVLGPLLVAGAAAPHLGEGASIINISSNVTAVLPAGSAIYSGTKGAVNAITGVLARELGPRGIRVNAVNPGLIETEGTHAAGAIGSEFHAWNEARTPLGRIGQVQDIAPIVSYLASDDARWVTGEIIFGSGGMR